FYSHHARYRYPSLRMRATVSKQVLRHLQMGLKTGAEVHYFEYDQLGGTETYFSFPIQAVATIRSIGINKKWAIYNSLSAGINFNNWSKPEMYKDAGFIGSFDLS